MMADILIRPCQSGDLPAVRELLIQLTETAPAQVDFDPDWLAVLLRQMDAAPDFYHNLVALHEERVVGLISLIFYKALYHHGGTALINELVVDRAARASGIGRALVERAIAEARARGMDEIEVGTEHDNHRAIAFYRRCGFDEDYLLLGMEFDD